MPALDSTAKILMTIGVVLFAVGALLALTGKIGWLGRLPGDFRFQRDGFSFYFPLATCLILSAILTLILNFLFRRR